MILLDRCKSGPGPTVQDNLIRISEHLEHRSNSPIVHLIWRGHMQALLEWGFVSADEFAAVVRMLDAPEGIAFPLIAEIRKDQRTGMEIIPPTDEFMKIIRSSVAAHGDTDTIKLIWRGYLAALQEYFDFGWIQYGVVRRQLRDLGSDEIGEMFIGFVRD